MGRYAWPDDATLLVDLDVRRGFRAGSGDLPLEDAVTEALAKALLPYEVEVRQNGKGGVLALRWPCDEYTILLIAQGMHASISDKPWEQLSAAGRNSRLREARRVAEYGLQAVKLGVAA